MPHYLCITGTDTDAGKTLVTAGLARAALAAGKRVLLLKPVQTGAVHAGTAHIGPPHTGKDALQAPDLAVYRRIAPGAAAMALSLFAAPCSPHLAARMEKRQLDAASLALAIRREAERRPVDLVLIEGAGGLLTPLNERETLADCFALLDASLLLVTANKLGAVNHALLSIECARMRGLALRGVIMNDPAPAAGELEAAIRDDNGAIIGALGRVPCLARVPYLAGLTDTKEADTERNGAGPCSLEADGVEAADRLAGILARALPHILPLAPESIRPEPEAATGAPAHFLSEPDCLLAFDREHVWHPYTSALRPLRSREATITRGTRIRLRDGRELVDGMASWWCAVHGYRHPALMAALNGQAARMPHVMFGGLTHEPAVRLASRLVQVAPKGLEHVFFSDSGSVAVEVAIKMALQYHQATGRPERKRLLALRGGYHGDTIGAMSLCDPETGMHHLFAGVLPEQLFAPRPECRFDAPYDPASAQSLEAALAERGHEVAALILEPVVQGAGGMWMYHPDYLKRARELCDRYGCLLIADEIATGFGRTGRYFACEHAGVSPDIMCVGKALTGGVMGLAATVAGRTVAHGISGRGGVFMHGPTFMGNPLACAVASASLDLLASEQWKTDVARIEGLLHQGLAPCRDMPGVADVRVLGAIGVLEMDAAVDVEGVQQYCVDECGVWIRPFGKLIYVMPPYSSSDEDISRLTTAMRSAVEREHWRDLRAEAGKKST